MTYFRVLEKEQYAKPQVSKWKETVRSRHKLMKWKQASRQATKLTQRINEIKSGLFGKIHKIDKPLGKPTGRELRSK